MGTGELRGKARQHEGTIYTVSEAAKHLRVSPSWLSRSDCPRVRFGTKMVRYPRTELLEWFASHLNGSVGNPSADRECR